MTNSRQLHNMLKYFGVLGQLVELVDLQALSYDLSGNNKEYKRLNDAILKSEVPTPWRESDSSIYSRIIPTRTRASLLVYFLLLSKLPKVQPTGQFAGQYEKVQKWNKVINHYKSTTYIIIENGLKWTTVELSD